MSPGKLPDLLPERLSWIRAAVSSIPGVGSALDHLIFDKADAIRLRNVEAAISSVSEQLQRFNQDKIDKEWFASEEALAAFKMMADAVSYEPDSKKVEDIGRIIATCGEKQHSRDDNKLSVVDHLSRLSHAQIKLLSIMGKVAPKKKEFDNGGLKQTATAIWLSDIVSTLHATPKFWKGVMNLDQEMEILESYNTIRRIQLMVASEAGYAFTGIGKRAASFADSAGI